MKNAPLAFFVTGLKWPLVVHLVWFLLCAAIQFTGLKKRKSPKTSGIEFLTILASPFFQLTAALLSLLGSEFLGNPWSYKIQYALWGGSELALLGLVLREVRAKKLGSGNTKGIYSKLVILGLLIGLSMDPQNWMEVMLIVHILVSIFTFSFLRVQGTDFRLALRNFTFQAGLLLLAILATFFEAPIVSGLFRILSNVFLFQFLNLFLVRAYVHRAFSINTTSALGPASLTVLLVSGLSFLVTSCSSTNHVNMRSHKFDEFPKKVVWLQIPGLELEHLAFLRFAYPRSSLRTPFEKSLCVGSTWTYNLFDIRPSERSGSLTQLTGKKNITGTCEDFNHVPVWDFFKEMGHKVGILENTAGMNSSLKMNDSCKGEKAFFQNAIVWKMGRQSKDLQKSYSTQTFHNLKKQVFQEGETYIDQSCHKEGCYSSLSENVRAVFQYMKEESSQYFLLIRDLSYLEALKGQNILKARENLSEIAKIYGHFLEEAKKDAEFTLLLTSSAPLGIEFPQSGKEWANYEKSGKFVTYHKTSLVSPTFAAGARAENFCGLYEEAEVFLRLILDPNEEFPVDIQQIFQSYH